MININTRKCNICKKLIDISESSSDDYFFKQTGKVRTFFHSQCYMEQQTHKKRKPLTEEECAFCISQIKTENEILKSEEKKTQEKRLVKDQLYNFISDMYDISFFPKFFYVKMDSVYKGEYKGLKKPVPPEHLLDMWEQKKSYLLKIYERNRTHGKEIDGLQRVYYDLAILLSKYDSYLSWKDKQENVQMDEQERKRHAVDFNNQKVVSRNIPNNNKVRNNVGNNNIDINSILDDI